MAEWRKKTGGFSIARFTDENVEQYRQSELLAAKGDHVRVGKVTTTTNSYLRGAKAVFAKKMMASYVELEMPDFIPFREVSLNKEPSHRYRSKIEVPVLVKKAREELKGQDDEVWITFLLGFGSGLRRNEIDKLILSQLDFEERRIWIRTTPYFRPKTHSSEDCVDVGEGIMAEISQYVETTTRQDSLFLLPGSLFQGSKLRCRAIFDRLNRWLRQNGVDEYNPLHTLRKEAGSMLFERDGSLHKVAEFLRNDISVAREHYVGRKERLEISLPGL